MDEKNNAQYQEEDKNTYVLNENNLEVQQKPFEY